MKEILDSLYLGFLSDFWVVYLLKSFLSVAIGFFISFSLIISGQSWAKSFSNVTTYCILPLIGFVITSVIAGNIALSLGMVGALSIIRFRHPVKSPLELSIYFLLLTVGITIDSSIPKAIILSLISMTIVYGYAIYRMKRMDIPGSFPVISFVREDPQYILDISSSKQNNFLNNNIHLIFSNENKSKSIYTYKLAFGNKKDLDRLKTQISNEENIYEITTSCV